MVVLSESQGLWTSDVRQNAFIILRIRKVFDVRLWGLGPRGL